MNSCKIEEKCNFTFYIILVRFTSSELTGVSVTVWLVLAGLRTGLICEGGLAI